MQQGSVGILNVGAGDTKLSFDPGNVAERIRSARIVTDMIRRGYVLLVEIGDGKGGKTYTRARDFREDTCEYIIADFDPFVAAKVDEEDDAQIESSAAAAPEGEVAKAVPPEKKRGRPKMVAVAAEHTNAIAVARSAGG